VIRFDETTVGYDFAEARVRESENSEVAFPNRACQERVALSLLNGLVVSSDAEVRRKLPKSWARAG
jgi:exosortase/archaeosortase